jgi:hypothetical protein
LTPLKVRALGLDLEPPYRSQPWALTLTPLKVRTISAICHMPLRVVAICHMPLRFCKKSFAIIVSKLLLHCFAGKTYVTLRVVAIIVFAIIVEVHIPTRLYISNSKTGHPRFSNIFSTECEFIGPPKNTKRHNLL